MSSIEELKKKIPEYPKACSKELLAYACGYIKAPYTEKLITKGIKKLERDLAWLTVEETTLVSKVLPLQRSTNERIKEMNEMKGKKGQEIPLIRKEELEYLSIGKR